MLALIVAYALGQLDPEFFGSPGSGLESWGGESSRLAYEMCRARLDQPASTWLSGAHITVGEVQWAPYGIRNESAPKGWSGFDIDLIDMVAERLNFTYDIVALERGPSLQCNPEACFVGEDEPPQESWDDVLMRGVQQTDLILSWWTQKPSRRDELGMLLGHVDDSPTMLVRTYLVQDFWADVVERGFAFLDPFTYELWITIVALILFGGFSDYLLEREEGGRLGKSICASRRPTPHSPARVPILCPSSPSPVLALPQLSLHRPHPPPPRGRVRRRGLCRRLLRRIRPAAHTPLRRLPDLTFILHACHHRRVRHARALPSARSPCAGARWPD